MGDSKFKPAGGALWGRAEEDLGAAMPLHYPASASQRPGAGQCGRPSRAEAQDTVAGRHDASGDVAPGVHAAAGGAGAKAKATSDSVPRGPGPECQAASEGGAPAMRGACSGSGIAGGCRGSSRSADALGVGEATEAGV